MTGTSLVNGTTVIAAASKWADELVNHESVLAWTRTLEPPPRVSIFPGADHFFHGRITELRQTVGEWLGDSES